MDDNAVKRERDGKLRIETPVLDIESLVRVLEVLKTGNKKDPTFDLKHAFKSLVEDVGTEIRHVPATEEGYHGRGSFKDGIFEDEKGQYAYVAAYGIFRIDSSKLGQDNLHSLAWTIADKIDREKKDPRVARVSVGSQFDVSRYLAAEHLISQGYLVKVDGKELKNIVGTTGKKAIAKQLVREYKTRAYDRWLSKTYDPSKDIRPDEIKLSSTWNAGHEGKIGEDLVLYQVRVPTLYLSGSLDKLAGHARAEIEVQAAPDAQKCIRCTKAAEAIIERVEKDISNVLSQYDGGKEQQGGR